MSIANKDFLKEIDEILRTTRIQKSKGFDYEYADIPKKERSVSEKAEQRADKNLYVVYKIVGEEKRIIAWNVPRLERDIILAENCNSKLMDHGFTRFESEIQGD